jgi:hypothetical protein
MDTMGDVMGDDLDGDDLDGDVMGDDLDGMAVVGRRVIRARTGAMARLARKPDWRHGIVTPGIALPRQGMEMLTFVPDSNGGVFDTTNIGALITFTARPQRPYRPERLVAFVSRTADAVAGVPAGFVLSDGIFVGTALNQLTRGEFNIEVYGPTAFGVRMSLSEASPGIDITIKCRLTIPPVGTQAVGVSLQFLGRSLR